ncbi:MAG: hypothetical protein E7070_10060 [Bacteroidales bacterium]|jgi:hypothetical protein|nr:hypothetical protein [Bacteroidales bacterium]
MKKIYFLAAMAAACMTEASAENYATKLENTQVYYLTNDTVTMKEVMVENEETGEEEPVVKETFWAGNDLKTAYKALNLPLNGTSAAKTNFQFRTRKNYVDSETGFNMPAGFYRGILVDGTMELSGYDNNENYMVGFQNVKSLVLYFAPIPDFWEGTKWSIYVADYPTGRVQARYMSLENTGETVGGTAISNQAYREIHIEKEKTEYEKDGLAYTEYKTQTCGYVRDADDYRKATIDQVYKLKVNLNNQLDGSAYESLFASDTKKAEFANLMCATDGYESEMSYYFADVNTTRPNADNAAFSSSATGYDCYENKWGVKLPWSAETIMQLQIKKRMFLVGYAIVSASDNASSVFMNASEGANATWSAEGKAYGNYADEISGIEETSIATADENGRIYDITGKLNKTGKGLQIRAGKVEFIK